MVAGSVEMAIAFLAKVGYPKDRQKTLPTTLSGWFDKSTTGIHTDRQ
jgi:hypothetical protein